MEVDDPKFSPKLTMWYVEAHMEKKRWHENSRICEDYALYPQRFYRTVALLDHRKTIDYCFIGAFDIDAVTRRNRSWIKDFIKNNFSESSYLQFTDAKTRAQHVSLGSFDHTLRKKGFVPKENPVHKRNMFDVEYFRVMAQSRFVLCPAGDKMWSMRFYESLMCRAIPIVCDARETFRSKREAELDYNFYLTTDRHVYSEDMVAHNYEIFLRYHTLEYQRD